MRIGSIPRKSKHKSKNIVHCCAQEFKLSHAGIHHSQARRCLLAVGTPGEHVRMQHMGDVKGWIGGEAQPKREGKKARSAQPKGKEARGSDCWLILEQASECEIGFASWDG